MFGLVFCDLAFCYVMFDLVSCDLAFCYVLLDLVLCDILLLLLMFGLVLSYNISLYLHATSFCFDTYSVKKKRLS